MRSLLALLSKQAGPRARRHVRPVRACDPVQPLERRVLLSSGELDPTFGGGDGRVRTDTPFPVRWIEALPGAGAGFVAAAGEPGSFGVAKFRADGSLDAAFGGGDGLATTAFPAAVRNPYAGAALPLPGGKVIAYGGGDVGPEGAASRVILLARFNADGSLDTTFSPGGDEGAGRAVLTQPVPRAAFTSDMALAPDGGIILIGATADEETFVARIRPDGTADASFGGGRGYVTEQPFQFYDPDDDREYPAESSVVDVKVLPDGRILVLGDTSRRHPDPNYKVQHDLTLFRYLPDGRRDATFAGSGFTATDVYNRGAIPDAYDGEVSFDFASTLALLPDGRFLVGELEDTSSPRVLMYDAGGGFLKQLDDRYNDGANEVVLPGVDAFAVFPDGRFVAAGGTRGFEVFGYRADGSLDLAYAPPNGHDVATFGGGARTYAAVARPDGKVDVAGLASTTLTGPTRFALARFQGASAGDAIALADGTLTVTGTPGTDSLFIDPHTDPATGRRQVVVNYNGVERFLDADAVRRIVLDGGGGDDVLIVGKDLFVPATVRGGGGNDILGGGGGRDEIFGGDGSDTVTYGDRTNNLFISLDDVANDGGNRDENVHSDVENVIGGSGDDVIVGSSAPNRLEGMGGNDTLTGLGGLDVLLGGPGDDDLHDNPREGNTLVGGPGADTINGEAEDPNATLEYQAEEAQLVIAQERRDHPGYTGTGYVDYIRSAGDAIIWKVEGRRSGTFTLTFRYANGSSANRPLELRVNGRQVANGLSFPSTGSWSTWRTASIDVELDGSIDNDVFLRSMGFNGPNVDKLTVAPVGQPPPGPDTYQAEAARLVGVGVARGNAGYTGAGYADFGTSPGQFVEWTVNAAEARRYVLEFRYANGGRGDRPLALKVDGATPAGVTNPLPFAPTGSWASWRTASVTVTLSAGQHRVRLESLGAGPNVDALTVRPA